MINLKLTVLVDNNTFIDRYFLAEPAVSYYIEDGNKTILFDVGYSNAYIRNAEKMGINLRKLDYVVLSHGHSDHTWGIEPLIRLYSEAKIEGLDFKIPAVVAHPEVFQTKLLDGEEIGSLLSEEKIAQHFKLGYSKEPIWLTDKLVFLGEIERLFNFEGKEPIGKIKQGEESKDDTILDDSALVYKTENGLVIIVACSHSGICNTIEYAKKVCQEERILDIIGGFHLLQPSENQIKNTVNYFKSLIPETIHACHCTDFQSKVAISEVANVKEVGVGLRLEY
ncbi:MBL fold metallo-hydrolase [Neobacillus sp. PS3-40]|uniref:MBL fold metallo-hydrolase n=1 Tax=Neobacillus sp. PS3-40 TaxID=3070679 RepID=UPI0027E1A074|nr:MBL fold metallo-hydrolase [Neobacillus sp. PS3-40]WML43976.1 MBL fold metallo-hydrolase [Neobacillus sp. PS3-40]